MNLFAGRQSKNRPDPLCLGTRELLGAYVDNSLSARQAWEVEKHLATCKPCALMSRQMQATVTLLRGAERADTSDDFMARLHARLDDAAPAIPSRPDPADWAREMWGRGVDGAKRGRVPASAFGMAGAGLVALALFVTRPTLAPSVPAAVDAPAVTQAIANVSTRENSQRNVALTANDPLGDVAAEALENAESPVAPAGPGNAPSGGVPTAPAIAPTNGS